MTGRSAQSNVAAVRQQAKESVAKRVVEKVAPIAVRPVMPASAEQMSKLRMKLSTAGFRAENGPTVFLASKTVVAGTGGCGRRCICVGEPHRDSKGLWELFCWGPVSVSWHPISGYVWLSPSERISSERDWPTRWTCS